MKINWNFIFFVLVLSFILGFVKPFVSDEQHLFLTLISLAALWVWLLFFKKPKVKNRNFDFWARIFNLIFALIALSLIESLFPTEQKLINILKLLTLLIGGVYCFSENFRLSIAMLISRFKE